IGPSSFASRVRFCTGAEESSDSMLPTTGLVGGCGIGLSLFFFGAIADLFPSQLRRHCERSEAIQFPTCGAMDCFVASLLAMTIHPNRFLRHSISLALTSSGFSCCVQWPLSFTR